MTFNAFCQRIALLLLMLPLRAVAAGWVVEAEGDGRVTWSRDSVADIHAPGGLTLWNRRRLSGDVAIEYEARIVGDGRVSDLNCFWMASDPSARDVFARMRERGGRFVNTYTMQLYYVGYGGNHNSTTRFRRYGGDARGVEDAAFRPAILREYVDGKHMIEADHWYRIRLEAIGGRVRYIIDGECLVDYVDPRPLTEGWFGFRTTLAHAQLRRFRVETIREPAPRIVRLDAGDSMRLPGDGRGDMAARSIPTTFGVPFAQGELEAKARLAVTTDSGETLASDQWTLASWPDGSVKWKAVATVVPPSAGGLTLGRDDMRGRKAGKGGRAMKASGAGSELTLWPSASGCVLDSITLGGHRVCGAVWLELNGERQPVLSARLERAGDVRSCWRFDGQDFCLRIYTYRGSNEVKVVHTAFIDSLTNAGGLRSLELKAEVPMDGELHQRRVLFLVDSAASSAAGTGLATRVMDVKPLVARRPIRLDGSGLPADPMSRAVASQIAAWDGFRLSQLSPNAYSIRKRATGQSPWIGTIEGRRAPGVVAVGGRSGSMAFHLTDFWQSYPSTLRVDAARSGNAVVSLCMWSGEAEPFSFEHYDTIPHGLDAAYEDVQPGMSTALGIARTTTIYLYPSAQPVDSLAQMLPSLAGHPQYLPTPQYLHRKRAFGYWSLDRGTAIDSLLSGITDFYAREQERHAWYGFFNYGDFMHSYDAWRGEWRYDVGGYAWDNTELGTPAMLWYEFLRTGDATAYRLAEAMTCHCSEVDCYHRGPHAGLGTRHNVLHWGCGAKEARISQAFWNRFLYYLTADERSGDLMSEVRDADQLLYRLDPMRLAQPRSDKYPCTAPARLRIGPDWLAYAGNWFTEWERTGDASYRDKILAGMRSIAALPHGMFSGPKALGYDPATGIVTWEGDTAVQNTNHLATIMGGFEMMNEMMMSLSTPEWDTAWLRHAMEYKEKAFAISRNKFRIPRLNAYAYWLTGAQKAKDAAMTDLLKGNPFTTPYGFFTNDAATFTLDAIFLQEVF